MRKRTCWICEEYERLRLQAGQQGIRIETERPIAFVCKCDPAAPRFVLFGPLPKTRRDVDQLASDLKRHLGMTKTPGPKTKAARPNLLEIDDHILKNEESASLKHIAEQMGVTTRVVREAIREGIGAPEVTFKQYQAALFKNSKTSRDKSRLSLSKLKKSRRMF